jgi:hypothetical protein
VPAVVRIEGVAAMHAGLDLGFGLGSHAGQGTRFGRNSVLISHQRQTIDVDENNWAEIKMMWPAPAN